MIMNVQDFITEYNEDYYAEDVVSFLISEFDNQELELDDYLKYGKIEITLDGNTVQYKLGISDLGIKELNLSHYNKIENQPNWTGDKINDVPEKLVKDLKK